MIKPPLFAIKQPCLPCKFSVAKKVISRGNHGVLSSKKTSCRIMGVVPQPCSEWEVERVSACSCEGTHAGIMLLLGKLATHMCCACCTWRSSCACSRRASPGSCSSRVVPYPAGLKRSSSIFFTMASLLLLVASTSCASSADIPHRLPDPAPITASPLPAASVLPY